MRLFTLGFVFLIAVGILAVGILLVGDFLSLLGNNESIFVGFKDVRGLSKGDEVRAHGVPVGKVDDIRLLEEGVLVRCRLHKPIQLYKGYEIAIRASSALGGSLISIHRGDTSAGPAEPMKRLKDPPIDVWAGRAMPDAFEEVGKTVEENREGIKKAVDNIGQAAEKATETLEKVGDAADMVKNGEGTIQKLLTDDRIYRDLEKISSNFGEVSEKLNKGEGTIAKLLNEGRLYDDLSVVSEDLKAVTGDIKEITGGLRKGRGFAGKLLYDEQFSSDVQEIVDNLKVISGDIRNLTAGLREGKGTLGRLFQEDDLYEEATETLESLNNTLGRAGRATAWLSGNAFTFAESECSISRIFVRFEPDDKKYFQAGAAFLSFTTEGENVIYEDLVEENDDQVFIKPEIFIAYHFPHVFDNHLTMRVGLLEGKPGGAADFWWDDWGAFQHRVELSFFIRDAYNDLDDEDIDENIGGPMTRIHLKTALFPKMDGWFAKVLHSIKGYAGISRIQDDPELMMGIGFEYIEEDLRTLIGLVGAGT